MKTNTATGTTIRSSRSHNDPDCDIKVSIAHLVAAGDDAKVVASDFADAIIDACGEAEYVAIYDGMNIEVDVRIDACRTTVSIYKPGSDFEFDAATEEMEAIVAAVLARSDWRSDREEA